MLKKKLKGGRNEGRICLITHTLFHFLIFSSTDLLQVRAQVGHKSPQLFQSPGLPFLHLPQLLHRRKDLISKVGRNRKGLDTRSQSSSAKQPYNNKPEELNNTLFLSRVHLTPIFYFVFFRVRDISQVFKFRGCEGAEVYTKTMSECHRPSNNSKENGEGSWGGSRY